MAPGSGLEHQQSIQKPAYETAANIIPKTQNSQRRNQPAHKSVDKNQYISSQNVDQDTTSKSNSSRPLVHRINSVIPEASERDELTVNDAVHQTIEFPIDSVTAKRDKIAVKYLTDFERTEVDEYENLYYLADNNLKIKPTKLERLVNNGFDDEEGYYRVQKGDHIAYRFQLIEIIGKGAFG